MQKLVLLFTLISTCSFAQIEDIEAKLDLLQKVMLNPDAKVLASLVDESLVYVHSSGTVRDKKGFVDEFMKGWTKIYSSEFQDQEITFSNKSLAIVRHNWQADTNYNDNPGKIDILVLMVWKKTKGDWKMIARQAASIQR